MLLINNLPPMPPKINPTIVAKSFSHMDCAGNGRGFQSYRGFMCDYKRLFHGTDWTLADFLRYFNTMVVCDTNFYVKKKEAKGKMFRIIGPWKNVIFASGETGEILIKKFKNYKKNRLSMIDKFDFSEIDEDEERSTYHVDEVAYWLSSGRYIPAKRPMSIGDYASASSKSLSDAISRTRSSKHKKSTASKIISAAKKTFSISRKKKLSHQAVPEGV